MSGEEKFEIAKESIEEIRIAVNFMKSNAYKDSSNSYPDKEKGAYYTGKYEAYEYCLQLLNNKLRYLEKVKNFNKQS